MNERESFEYVEARPPFETIALDAEVRANIQKTALELPGGIYENSFQKRGDFLQACQKITEELEGSNIGPALKELKNGDRVAVTITNLPRDPELPAAPIDGRAPQGKKTFISEGLACGAGQSLGYPSLILGEKDEALVHQITPVPGREESQSNEGVVEQKLHQDLAPNPEAPKMRYDLFMPDWLILTGVQKGSGETPTYIASLDEALPRIQLWAREILSQDLFVTDPPYSFQKDGEEIDPRQLPAHPVLIINGQHFESVCDTSSNVRPRDPEDIEAAAALLELQQALATVKHEVVIEPGTMTIFNNRRVVHGRGPVRTEQENLGVKRWIQRLYVFDPKRIASQAMKNGLRIQAGGGLLRATSLAAPDVPGEFDKLLEDTK